MSFSALQTLCTVLIALSTLWTLFFGYVGIYDKLQGLGKVPRREWIAKLVALLKYAFIIISVGFAICVLILSTTLLFILLRPTGGPTPSPSIPPTVTQTQVNTTATAQTQASIDATATVRAILGGSCPATSDVAGAIGDDVNNVKRLADEPCAFTLEKVAQRTVHCPARYGKVSFQYTLPGIGTQHIRGCDGTETTSFPIEGATVRFVNWESTGDVCHLAQESTWLYP